jgi:hypothetical protein
MSIDSHLIHRCTIQRYLPVGDDSLKAPKKDWRPWIEGLRCRRVTKQQRVGDTAFAERPVTTTDMLLVPAGTDVQQGDRVVNVIDETGTTEVGTFKIESVIIRRGRAARHVSLILERVP